MTGAMRRTDQSSDEAPEVALAAEHSSARREPTEIGLGASYVAKARTLRSSFKANEDGTTSEIILEELVATEVPIAMALQDAEAALVSLLHRTITSPELAVAVTKLLKETVVVSGAVRRRIENSLGAVANLRAQRAFLERQRR